MVSTRSQTRIANANASIATHTSAMLSKDKRLHNYKNGDVYDGDCYEDQRLATAMQHKPQIKTRSKTQAIQKETTMRQDEIIAALALLAIHDMHDQQNAGWLPDTAHCEYQTQNRNNYTCNIL